MQHQGVQFIDTEREFIEKSHMLTVPHDALPAPLPTRCNNNAMFQFAVTCWIKIANVNSNGWSAVFHKVVIANFYIYRAIL